MSCANSPNNQRRKIWPAKALLLGRGREPFFRELNYTPIEFLMKNHRGVNTRSRIWRETYLFARIIIHVCVVQTRVRSVFDYVLIYSDLIKRGKNWRRGLIRCYARVELYWIWICRLTFVTTLTVTVGGLSIKVKTQRECCEIILGRVVRGWGAMMSVCM